MFYVNVCIIHRELEEEIGEMDETTSETEMEVCEGSEADQDQNPLDTSILLERILSVHVIKKKIFDFLSPQDVKNGVLVSR